MNLRLNLLLAVALLAACAASLLAGELWVPPGRWLAGDTAALIVTELRLPRVLLGAVVGAGLGASGAAMQGYLRNPLADPGLFGVSACAALGAVLAIGLSLGGLQWWALGGAAGGMAALGLLAGRAPSLGLFTLAGVMLSSLAGALLALVISLAPSPFESAEMLTWLAGALTDRGWSEVALAAPLTALGLAALALTARDLDALTLGEATARSLGVAVARTGWLVALGVGAAVGAGVAAAGAIGFVGLVVPHLLRPFVGARPGALLLPSALGGALLVVLADAGVRLLPGGSELRLGIAMALGGAPFFGWLLWRLRGQAE